MHAHSTSAPLTVTQRGDQLIAVRTATEPDDCARMCREANALSQLDHPGIVRLIDHAEGPPAQISTAFVGPDTWQTKPPTGERVAAALATATATVADLHEAGLAHGAIRAEHILVDPSGQPVLCGLSCAKAADPATIGTDVGALVEMGRSLASRAGADQETIELILATLEAGHEDLRGTARSLGRRRLPPAASRARIDRRAIAGAAGAMVALAVAVAVVIVLLRPVGEAAPPAAIPMPPLDAKPPGTTVPPPATSTIPPFAANKTSELIHDGRHYTIGRVGDVVVTGDWDCDGTSTPALLRPETGEIAVFADWPGANATIAPAAIFVIEGALALSVTDAACPILRATTATGSRLIDPSVSS